MDNFYLTHKGDEWQLKREGASRPIKSFETKQEAMSFSTGYVGEKTGSLRIQKQNGQFQEERTYPRRDDPKRSKG